MLRARDEADRVPRLQAARRLELCEAVERLGRAQGPEGLADRLALLEVEWVELAAGADEETELRFGAAVAGIRSILAQTESERAEHERRVLAMSADVSRAASTVDERDETLGKRIREAEVEKVPFVVVYGDRESEDALAVRERGGEQSTISLDDLLERFRDLRAESDPA